MKRLIDAVWAIIASLICYIVFMVTIVFLILCPGLIFVALLIAIEDSQPVIAEYVAYLPICSVLINFAFLYYQHYAGKKSYILLVAEKIFNSAFDFLLPTKNINYELKENKSSPITDKNMKMYADIYFGGECADLNKISDELKTHKQEKTESIIHFDDTLDDKTKIKKIMKEVRKILSKYDATLSYGELYKRAQLNIYKYRGLDSCLDYHFYALQMVAISASDYLSLTNHYVNGEALTSWEEEISRIYDAVLVEINK